MWKRQKIITLAMLFWLVFLVGFNAGQWDARHGFEYGFKAGAWLREFIGWK